MIFSLSSFFQSIPLVGLFLIVIFFLFKNKEVDKLFLIGLLMKIVLTYFYAITYQYYFKDGDTFYYYGNMLRLRNLFFENPLLYFKAMVLSVEDFPFEITQIFNFNNNSVSQFDEGGSFLVSKLASISSILLGQSYLTNSMFFSLITYLFSWKLFTQLQDNLNCPAWVLFPLFLLPSFMFWTSGITKEIFYIPALYYMVSFLFMREKKALDFILLIVFAYVIFSLKSFILYTFILSIVLAYFIRLFKSYSWYLALFTSVSVVFYFVFSQYSELFELVKTFQTAQIEATSLSQGSGYILTVNLDNILGVFYFLLQSFVVSLFRPFFFEINNLMTLVLFVESALSLALFFLFIINVKRIKFNFKHHGFQVLFFIIFVFVLSIIFGAVSFNYGTLMRFKVAVTPFFYTLLLFLLFKERPNQYV